MCDDDVYVFGMQLCVRVRVCVGTLDAVSVCERVSVFVHVLLWA